MITWAVIISPIQISVDKPPKCNIPLTEPRYKLDKTDNKLFHKTLQGSVNTIDTDIDAQDELEELNLMKAVDLSPPKVYSRNDPKTPISQATLNLIKGKRRLRCQYNITHDLNTKTFINRLQKDIKIKINEESSIS